MLPPAAVLLPDCHSEEPSRRTSIHSGHCVASPVSCRRTTASAMGHCKKGKGLATRLGLRAFACFCCTHYRSVQALTTPCSPAPWLMPSIGTCGSGPNPVPCKPHQILGDDIERRAASSSMHACAGPCHTQRAVPPPSHLPVWRWSLFVLCVQQVTRCALRISHTDNGQGDAQTAAASAKR